MIKNYATLNKNLKQYPFTYEWLIYNNLTNQNVDQNLVIIIL